MKIKDKVVVVTGAATGIGRGLCQRFKREGARAIDVAFLGARCSRSASLPSATCPAVASGVAQSVSRRRAANIPPTGPASRSSGFPI